MNPVAVFFVVFFLGVIAIGGAAPNGNNYVTGSAVWFPLIAGLISAAVEAGWEQRVRQKEILNRLQKD